MLANGAHSPGTWWPTLTFDLCQLQKIHGDVLRNLPAILTPLADILVGMSVREGKGPPNVGGQKPFTVLNGDVRLILMDPGKPKGEIS